MDLQDKLECKELWDLQAHKADQDPLDPLENRQHYLLLETWGHY